MKVELVSYAVAYSLALVATWANAISLGEVDLRSEINGVQVSFPVTLDLNVADLGDSVKLDISADVSMTDMQQKFDSIVKKLPVQTDNCPGYGQHVLPTVETAKLLARGQTAIIEADVYAKVWDCQAGVPLAGTTVRWEQRCVDLGRLGRPCVEVPVTVEAKTGPNIRSIIYEGGFVLTAPLSLNTPDGVSIEISPAAANVAPRNDVGKFLNTIAGVFNADLNSAAQKEISKAVDDGFLKQALPKEFLTYQPKIKLAEFRAGPDGKLITHVEFQASVTRDQLAALITQAIRE